MKSLDSEQLYLCKVLNKYSNEDITNKFNLINSYFKLLNNKEISEFCEDISNIISYVIKLYEEDEISVDTEVEEDILNINFIDTYLECNSLEDPFIKKIIDIYIKEEFKITRFNNMLKLFIDNINNMTIEMFRTCFYIFSSHSIIKMKDLNVIFYDEYNNRLKKIQKALLPMYKNILYNHIQKDITNLMNELKNNKDKYDETKIKASKDNETKTIEKEY